MKTSIYQLLSKLFYLTALLSVMVSCSEKLTTSDGDYTIKGTPPNDEVWYQTIDGKKLNISGLGYDEYEDELIADRVIKSHTYKGGIGVIKFVKPISIFSVDDINNRINNIIDQERIHAINLPESVKKICLHGCENLTDVKLPTRLEILDHSAFSECKALTHLNIPNSVTAINGYVFYNCGLTSIQLPSGLTFLDGCNFVKSNIETIYFPSTISEIDSYAFEENSYDDLEEHHTIQKVYIPCKTPPTVINPRWHYPPTTIKFLVPKESLEAYRTAEWWNEINANQFIGYDFN